MHNNPVDWKNAVNSNHKTISVLAYFLIFMFVGSIIIWGATVPLARAVIAQGKVITPGRNIQLQHVDGGAIKAISVKEGDQVRVDQVLYALDDQVLVNKIEYLVNKKNYLDAKLIRLIAERDGKSHLIFTDDLNEKTKLVNDFSIVDEQSNEFHAKLERFELEKEILKQRINNLLQSKNGIEAQLLSYNEQLDISKKESSIKENLYNKKIISYFEYSQVHRNKLQVEGRIGELAALLAAISEQITEAEAQLERLNTQRMEQAAVQINEIHVQLIDINEQIYTAKEAYGRTLIKSPVNGIIVSMNYNIAGNVIKAGEKIAEIVPLSDNRLIEAKITPAIIDNVYVGQSTKINLTALNEGKTLSIIGRVIEISADQIETEVEAQNYYRVQIEIKDASSIKGDMDRLYYGMPTEIYFNNAPRTFLQYIMRPIADSFSKAFIEF